ncbi:hypothetical protein DFR67_11469 [Williamsia limnetica]|jgi:hypothetical protein|uniref:Uncharacterized protein n=1 Tax=Williamsia limnetica TaxID=882452 RepID=A0A318RH92_WILLI|nr:hypothetical protein [Williamsia limnetica]PYE13972.1 hypothetical protein DFR67_11469 [Williamsia limnetica]
MAQLTLAARDRVDLATFAARALRGDDMAVLRIRARPDGLLGVWVNTGFDVLASRVVAGSISGDDVVCGATELRSALQEAASDPGTATVDTGFALDSAWHGALPPVAGFSHLDDVPARVLVQLARSGAEVARTQGSGHGPPTSLLDQRVLDVSADSSDEVVGVSMRSIFALTAMGFVRQSDNRDVTEASSIDLIDSGEMVRVRNTAVWIRLDARFGSVYQRRTMSLSLSVN